MAKATADGINHGDTEKGKAKAGKPVPATEQPMADGVNHRDTENTENDKARAPQPRPLSVPERGERRTPEATGQR